jgi:pyridoxamine 5'-phosphate oxidase
MAKQNNDLNEFRNEYKGGYLNLHKIHQNPFQQFNLWFYDVQKLSIKDPNAMVLSTSNDRNEPSSRIVLLKEIIEYTGFSFFTNYESRKGKEIKINPKAAILFYWPSVDKQIRIEGAVEKLDDKKSDEYFHSRPFGSQVSAYISEQSQPIENRLLLEKRFTAFYTLNENQPIKRPQNWGGYILKPRYFEFWLGRENRLHDRIVYELFDDIWKISRLQP